MTIPQFQPPPSLPQVDPNAVSFLVKMEMIRRLFWLVVIGFITIRLLGHIDHWVETIWRH